MFRFLVLLILFSVSGIVGAQSTYITPDNASQLMPLNKFGLNSIVDVVYSPDGETITVAVNQDIALYSAENISISPRLLSGHQGSVISLAYSPDGTQLASGSTDNTVIVWDVTTGEVITSLTGHLTSVNEVIFHPSAPQILSVSEDGEIRLWDIATGDVVMTYAGHTGAVNSIAFHPDGTRFVSGGDDKLIAIWDVTMTAPVVTLSGHTSAVNVVLYSQDGALILSGAENVRSWDSQTGVQQQELNQFFSPITDIATRYDDDEIAILSDNTAVFFANSNNLNSWWMNDPYDKLVGAYHPTQSLLVLGGLYGELEVWDVSSGGNLQTLDAGLLTPSDMDWTPTQELIGVSYVSSSTVNLFDTQTGGLRQAIQTNHQDFVSQIALNPDASLLATVSYDESVRVFDAVTGDEIFALIDLGMLVNAVDFSPDSAILAYGGTNNKIHLIDMQTFTEIAVLTGHTGWVNRVVFSPDGLQIASSADDSTIRLWDVATGSLVRIFSGHTNKVISLAFSADGTLLASGSQDNTARVWDVASGTTIQTVTGNLWMRSVALSPDKQLLATGTQDGTFQVWDMNTGTALLTTNIYFAEITDMFFHADGTRIFVAVFDGAIDVWGLPDN